MVDLFDLNVDALLVRQSKEKDILEDTDVFMFSDKEEFENFSEEGK
ncbi:hypothetical protein ACFPFV_09295 [Salinicoccus siamensis]